MKTTATVTCPELTDLEQYRDQVRTMLREHAQPHHDEWERLHVVPKDFWRHAGDAGLLVPAAPTTYGGQGRTDPRYAAVVAEELVRAGVTAPGVVAHNDVATAYLLGRANDEQKQRWLPGLCTGETIAAIALTEPTGGSDMSGLRTTAQRTTDGYVLNGSKAFITNGGHADLIVVAARTSDGPAGLSMFVVDGDTPGVTRGDRLPTLGWQANDTCDLAFDDCVVPVENLLGREGAGTALLMKALPRERLSISVVAVASAERAFDAALVHAKSREAFGQPIGRLQHNRFTFATLHTELTLARVFVNHCLAEHAKNTLSVVDAAKAKWWTTELQNRVADFSLQIHGGRGYLDGNDISREWLNSRVQTIYGGPTEVMKEIIGHSLGL